MCFDRHLLISAPCLVPHLPIPQFQWFICPVEKLEFYLHPPLSCTPDPIYLVQNVSLPTNYLHDIFPEYVPYLTVEMKPIQVCRSATYCHRERLKTHLLFALKNTHDEICYQRWYSLAHSTFGADARSHPCLASINHRPFRRLSGIRHQASIRGEGLCWGHSWPRRNHRPHGLSATGMLEGNLPTSL